MKRHGNLFWRIAAEANLERAADLACRGRRSFQNVQRFLANRQDCLSRLRASLLEHTFHTSPYVARTVYEPKQRTIYVLPFYPDRIAQHALMRVLIPIWTPLFIKDSYACIDGRGIHAGSRRTMEFVHRNNYCLKCDISKFYPSIDQQILMDIVERKIKCPDTLWLLRDIIFSFPGGKNVPIGNLTSQWFGNLYLNELDTFVKERLKIRDYIRYCDDFCLFGNDKARLNEAAAAVQEFCDARLALRLSKCDLFPTSRGVDFLGYRHFRDYILLRKSTAKRVRRRLRRLPALLEAGKISLEQFRSSVDSTWGWLKWANTHNLAVSLDMENLKELAHGRKGS